MPGSPLWQCDEASVTALLNHLRGWPGEISGGITLLDSDGRCDGVIKGRLFGGCMAVLSGLIGTPHFPASLQDHILFLEDVNESLPRILRMLTHWVLSGSLQGVQAIVLGAFSHKDAKEREHLKNLCQRVSERINVPVFRSEQFGHVQDNWPLAIGADAEISTGKLRWRLASASD